MGGVQPMSHQVRNLTDENIVKKLLKTDFSAVYSILYADYKFITVLYQPGKLMALFIYLSTSLQLALYLLAKYVIQIVR